MGDIHVRSIQILINLKNEIFKFGFDTREILDQLDSELYRTQQWLEQRKQYWEGRVRSCEANVRQAQAALERCENSGRDCRDDERSQPPDCSSEQMALARAQAELQEAQNNLANVIRWIRALEEAALTYRKKAQSMHRFIEKELTKARLYLEEKASVLKDYIAISISDSVYNTTAGSDQGSLKFGELEINNTYIRNGYEYLTDEQGRVELVSGNLYLGTGERTSHQTEVGHMGYESDEGGHLIATIFNGSPEGLNLIPQDTNLNRGPWRNMEKEWADALKEGKKVNVLMQAVYLDDSLRPLGFQVEYTINSTPYTKYFFNQPKGD